MTPTPSNATDAVSLPEAPAIPGLRFRSYDIAADSEGLAALITACSLADGQEFALSAEEVRHDLENTSNFDPARDAIAAELDGQLVAAIEGHIVVRDGTAVHQFEGWVHPDHRRRGIGRALLHWVERRAHEAAGEWDGDEPHELGAWVDDKMADGLALLEGEGYRQVRYGFQMIRSLAEPIPEAPLPPGLEIRPVLERDHRAIWDADVEAFRDHFEAATRTEADFRRWFTMPNLDTDLWRVAWAGDEVAGSVWNLVWPEENERLGLSRGWLEHISVRRPWRKQGLASALIADSLRMFRDMGLREGALGVDAENPTGALRLYESLGFRRHRTGISFRKSM
jgi:mycothiol synthase